MERLLVSVCMLTVSNVLLLFSVTVIVRTGGLFWLKPVAMGQAVQQTFMKK